MSSNFYAVSYFHDPSLLLEIPRDNNGQLFYDMAETIPGTTNVKKIYIRNNMDEKISLSAIIMDDRIDMVVPDHLEALQKGEIEFVYNKAKNDLKSLRGGWKLEIRVGD